MFDGKFEQERMTSISLGGATNVSYIKEHLGDSQARTLGATILENASLPKQAVLPKQAEDKPRLSRGEVWVVDVDGERKAVVRPMLRGGLVGKFNRDLFFSPRLPGLGVKNRAEKELALTDYLFSQGLAVAKPLLGMASNCFGSLFSRQYFVSEFLAGHENLLALLAPSSISQDNKSNLAIPLEGLLAGALENAGAEAARLAEMRVWHVDLHPGNVLLNESLGKIRLIDFDKARVCGDLKVSDLKARYLVRWERSVKKHALSPSVGALFARGLGS